MNRILILSALLIAVCFTTDAQSSRRRALMSARPAAAATSPEPELVWWKLNEGSGTTIAGSAAISDDGTTDAAWLTGKSGSGSCLDFIPGNSDDAATTSTIAFGSSIITVCAWVYWDVVSGASKVLWESSASYSANNYGFIAYTDTSVFYAGVSGNAANFRTEEVAAPATGTWVHVAVVYDNSTATGDIKIYFDGVLQSESLTSNNKIGSGNLSTYTFYVGARASASAFMDGRVDDVRVYSSDVSSSLSAIVADPQ